MVMVWHEAANAKDPPDAWCAPQPPGESGAPGAEPGDDERLWLPPALRSTLTYAGGG